MTAFAQWLLPNFCYVYMTKFAGDCFAVDPESALFLSASQTAKRICNLPSLPLDGAKEWDPAATIEILGATVVFGREYVDAKLPEWWRS